MAVTAREFHQGRDRSVVLYWTQEGPHVWSDSDERAAEREMLASGWSGHQWVGRLLGATAQAGPRLQVVVIVPTSGTTAKKDAATLSQHIAAELYRVCPWAKPPLPPLLVAPVPPPPNPVGATQ